MRIQDLRHTYASLARSAGADLKLLQQTMGHASITVTAHTDADPFDSDLDRVADALDTLTPRSASSRIFSVTTDPTCAPEATHSFADDPLWMPPTAAVRLNNAAGPTRCTVHQRCWASE
jgi:hypothetical protein